MHHVLSSEGLLQCVRLVSPHIHSDRLSYTTTTPSNHEDASIAVIIAPSGLEIIGGRWDGLRGFSFGGIEFSGLSKSIHVKKVLSQDENTDEITKIIIFADINIEGFNKLPVEYHIQTRPICGVKYEKIKEVPKSFIAE
jgi:hypothetical protein